MEREKKKKMDYDYNECDEGETIPKSYFDLILSISHRIRTTCGSGKV